MTQFVEYQKTPADPYYLGLSKETSVPQVQDSASTAISDITKIGTGLLGAVDDMNKNTIDKELLSGVNAERKESIQTGLDLLADKEPTNLYNPDGSPAVPASVNQELRRAEMLTQARKAGRIEDINYYGNMQEIAQRLVSRYPGYERYITDRMTHWLGSNPANQQRAAILETLRRENSEDSAVNRNIRELHGDQKYFTDVNGQFNQPMWQQAYIAAVTNDQQGMANYRTFVAQQKVHEHNRDMQIKNLQLASAQGTNNEDIALRGYRGAATSHIQGELDKYRFQLGGNSYSVNNIRDLIGKIIDKDGGIIDKDALSRLGLSIGQLRDKVDLELKQMAQRPEFINNVKEVAKLQAVRTEVMGVMDDLVKNVGEKNLHLFSNDLNTFAGIEERNAVNSIRSSADVARWNAYTKLFSGQVAAGLVNHENAQSGYVMQGGVSKAIANATMKDVLSGGSISLNDALKRFITVNGPATTPQQATEQATFLNQQITWAQSIITSPTAMPEHKERAARYIASGGTTEFLLKLPREEQVSAWARMAAPQVAAGVKQNVTPSEWRNYRSWAQETFKGLMAVQIDQINRGQENGINLKLVLDDNNNIVPDISGRTGRLARQAQGGMPAGLSRDTIQAISDINMGLDTYANILKLDGKKLDDRELEALGLKVQRPTTGGSTGSGAKGKRTSEAPNGSEGQPTVTLASPFSQENPQNMGPSVAQFVRDPTSASWRQPSTANDRVRAGFRGMAEAEMDNPGLYVHDDQGIGAELRNSILPPGATLNEGPAGLGPHVRQEDIDAIYEQFKQRGAGRANMPDLIRSIIHMYTGQDPGELSYPLARDAVGQPQQKGRPSFPQPRR